MLVGSKFKLTNAAIDNYGEQYRDKVFVVSHVADHYVPASEYFDPSSSRYQESGGHPGYDEGAAPQRLYDSDFVGAVYGWEVIPVYVEE